MFASYQMMQKLVHSYKIFFFISPTFLLQIPKMKFLLKNRCMILILKFHLSEPQYILNANDFIVLEYVNTYKSGVFNSNTKKYNKPVFLKINYTGNKPYTEEYNGLLGSKDFGKIYLLPNINVLDEVIIKASAPPIRVKKDTLEFNASSYKERLDANVKILLKQLAGFDVDNEVSLNESNAK